MFEKRSFTNRLSYTIDSNQPKEHAGFRNLQTTQNRTHKWTWIRKKTNEYRKPLCMTFFDYEKGIRTYKHNVCAQIQCVRKQQKWYIVEIFKIHITPYKIPMESQLKMFLGIEEIILKMLDCYGNGFGIKHRCLQTFCSPTL